VEVDPTLGSEMGYQNSFLTNGITNFSSQPYDGFLDQSLEFCFELPESLVSVVDPYAKLTTETYNFSSQPF